MPESLDYKIDAYIRSIDYNLKHDLRRVDDLLLNLEGLEPDVCIAILMYTWPSRDLLYWRTLAIHRSMSHIEKYESSVQFLLEKDK